MRYVFDRQLIDDFLLLWFHHLYMCLGQVDGQVIHQFQKHVHAYLWVFETNVSSCSRSKRFGWPLFQPCFSIHKGWAKSTMNYRQHRVACAACGQNAAKSVKTQWIHWRWWARGRMKVIHAQTLNGRVWSIYLHLADSLPMIIHDDSLPMVHFVLSIRQNESWPIHKHYCPLPWCHITNVPPKKGPYHWIILDCFTPFSLENDHSSRW